MFAGDQGTKGTMSPTATVLASPNIMGLTRVGLNQSVNHNASE